jgi:hypothetical protein
MSSSTVRSGRVVPGELVCGVDEFSWHRARVSGGSGPLGLFWEAARNLDPGVHDESGLAGAREGHLVELFVAAGLGAVEAATVVARVEYDTFEDWWAPFGGGVGPAGSYVVSLDPDRRAALRDECRARAAGGALLRVGNGLGGPGRRAGDLSPSRSGSIRAQLGAGAAI